MRDRRRRPRAGTGEAFVGDGAGDQLGQRRDHAWTGWASPRPRRGSSTGWRRKGIGEAHRHLQAARLAVQPAALLGRAVPDRVRRGRHRRIALPESMLPVELPEVDDYSPRTFDPDDADSRAGAAAGPQGRLGRRRRWTWATARRRYRRETNTMPQWAGSCWYELRYLDPTNDERFVDPEVERYWMGPQGRGHTGGVDLYVGGAEHAVLHLLYARFWHKVLFDLGHVSSSEPFHRLFNQGMIQAYAYPTSRGIYVPAAEVEERDGGVHLARASRSPASTGKMGKSLKNAVTPDEMCDEYGADTLRLYEMSMGPLDVVAAVGDPRGRRLVPVPAAAVAQRRRRGDRRGRASSTDAADEETRAAAAPHDRRRSAHDMDGAALQHRDRQADRAEQPPGQGRRRAPREVAEPLVLMVAPLAPHLAEELWRRLGHDESLALRATFPVGRPGAAGGRDR